MEEKKLIPMDGMRKLIAERMKASQDQTAQTTHQVYVDMLAAGQLRQKLKEEGKKVSYNDMILAATTHALMDHPFMNCEITPDGIWVKDFVNMGIAVALEEGLIVPNIKNAHQMDLFGISAAAADLSKRAKEGRLKASEYRKGTFTVSNLGMMGIDSFVAIINVPEAGILAVGKITDTPVAREGEICIRPMLSLTLSYDHRINDGEPAARFLVCVKNYLEAPEKLLNAKEAKA